jgi:lipopolysaccharide transport system permease protein
MAKDDSLVTDVITPPQGWQSINLAELVRYKDLFYSLVWRDVKVLYAQSIMGFSWALLVPLIQIIVFTIIFGKLAKLDTGGVPYFLFSTLAILPWTYMQSVLDKSSSSLVAQQSILGKVYIPRLIFPIVPVLSKLIDFTLSLLLLIPILIYYKVSPTWNLIFIPIFVVMMMAVPAAIGIFLSSLAIRYRDVKFALQFVLKLLIYSAPILYSADKIPEAYRLLYSLNPIVGVIEGFRATILGTDIPWLYIFPGMITCAIGLWLGAMYFKRMERVFVDVI